MIVMIIANFIKKVYLTEKATAVSLYFFGDEEVNIKGKIIKDIQITHKIIVYNYNDVLFCRKSLVTKL